MKFFRSEVPVILAIAGGAVVFLAAFFVPPMLQTLSHWFLEWRVILAAFALALGAGNLLRVHTNRIRMKRGAWQFSSVTVVSLVLVFATGVLASPEHEAYRFMFDYIYAPLGATVFSLNAFFLTTACYRAFRMRNLYAAVLLVSGLFVMLGRVGIGYAMWSGFPDIADWIMNYPNSAAMRAVNMCAALGILGVALRVLLGLERSYLGGLE